MKSERANHKISTMCRLLGVSTSGFYAWVKRPPSLRQLEDESITGFIFDSWERSRNNYGSPRINRDLVDDHDIHCSTKRVARLMSAQQIQGCNPKRFVRTTKRDRGARPAPDLLTRKFGAQRPGRVLVADITYVPTWEGFLYLGVILDVFTRAIVGWSMRYDLGAEIVVDAFDMACSRRKLEPGAIHHSDQGSQYASLEFGRRLRDSGAVASMGSVGDCFDNAMAESFFATLEKELIMKNTFKTRTQARMAVFDYIERFYNPIRRHSSIGNLSPLEFERRWLKENAGV